MQSNFADSPTKVRSALGSRGRQSQTRSLQAKGTLASLTEALLLVLVVCMFIPEAIAIEIGQVKLTPAFAVSIILTPLLIGAVRIRWVWPDVLVIGLFSCYFVSTALNSPLDRAIESIGRALLISMVPYLAGRFIIRDFSRMTRVFGLLVSLIAIMAFLAVFESFYRFNIHSVIWDVPYWPHHEQRLGLTRAHGWTSHAIMFGLVNACVIPVILIAIKEKIDIVGRWKLFKLFAVLLGCFLSLSTGAWGPAALSMMFVFWDYYGPLKHKWLWPTTFALGIGGYFALELLSNRPLLRILMMNLHISSAEAWWYRWVLYQRVYSVMPGHWWWGHGLDTPDEFVGFQRSIDNNFLVILLRYGRIGLIMWISTFIAVLLFAGKAVWAAKPTRCVRLARALCFSLIGMALTQLSVALFSTPASLYWLIVGLIIGATLQCRSEQRTLANRKRRAKRFSSARQHARSITKPA